MNLVFILLLPTFASGILNLNSFNKLPTIIKEISNSKDKKVDITTRDTIQHVLDAEVESVPLAKSVY